MPNIEYGQLTALEDMSPAELLGQEIANKAAIHSLQHLLLIGVNETNAKDMIASLNQSQSAVEVLKQPRTTGESDYKDGRNYEKAWEKYQIENVSLFEKIISDLKIPMVSTPKRITVRFLNEEEHWDVVDQYRRACGVQV